MKKIFWDNPYQRHLITHVSSVNDNRILFDETIAFSFSGGQESDKAYINGIEGFSKVPCGGTHVKSTSEVGFITLKRVNIGGGKERIEIRLVDDVLGLK